MLVCVLWWRVMMQVKREREEREALGALPLYQRTIPWAILQQQQRYFLLNKRKKGVFGIFMVGLHGRKKSCVVTIVIVTRSFSFDLYLYSYCFVLCYYSYINLFVMWFYQWVGQFKRVFF